MVKKTAAFLGRSSVWFLTIALALFLLFLARVMIAPLDVSFARDYVRGQTEQLLPGWKVDFKQAVLKWDWSKVQLELDVEDFFVVDRLDRLRADFKSLKLDIDRDLLYSGSFKLVNFIGKDAIVTVSDLAGFSDESQSDQLFKKSSKTNVSFLTPASMKPLTEGLTRFTRRLLAQQSKLDNLSFENFHLLIAAGKGQAPVNLHLSYIHLNHADNLLSFTAKGDTDIANLPTDIDLSGSLNAEEGRLDVKVSLTDILVSEISKSLKLPDIINSMDFPVSISSSLMSSEEKGLETADLTLHIDEGEIYHDYHFPSKGKVIDGLVSLSFDPALNQLLIKDSEIRLNHGDDITLNLTGVLFWEGNNPRPGLKFRVKTDNANLNHVRAFWPVLTSKVTGKPAAGRIWVMSNIEKFNATDIVFDVDVSPNGTGQLKGNSPLELKFKVSDLTTSYLKGMPLITKAKAQGYLTATDILLTVSDGYVSDLPVKGSKAYINWARKKSQNAYGEFTVKTSGKVLDMLDVISHPPLRLTEKFGIDYRRLGGDALVETKITVPFLKPLPKDAVKVVTTAKIENTFVKDVLGGEGLTDASLDMTVTNDQLYVEGRGKLNGVELDLSWLEDLKAGREDPTALTTRTILSGEIEAKDLAAFGINSMETYAVGKMPIEGTFLGRAFNFTEGYFSADATPAILKMDLLAWKKDIGTVANINGAININDNEIELLPLTIRGKDIDVNMNVRWDRINLLPSGGMPYSGLIKANKLDQHKLQVALSNKSEGVLNVDLNGERLDLNDLLSGRRIETSPDDAVIDFSVIDVKINVDQVLMKNNVIYKKFKANLFLDEGDPERMSLTTLDSEGFPLTGSISPRRTKGRGKKKREMNPMRLITDNGGELLRGLGVFSHGQKGSIEFNGEIMGWKGSDFNISGTFNAKNMMLVRASKLPKTVKTGMLEGINEFVDEKGLLMKKAKGKFTFKDTILDISSFNANSSNLGITLEGQYEDTTRRINMNGVVVPAYGLNSFLGKIPLIGNILTGGSGKGIFGVTYRLKGQGSDAKFTMNPLSAVTPGFLRNIFEGSKGKVKDVKIAPKKGDEKKAKSAKEDITKEAVDKKKLEKDKKSNEKKPPK